MFTRCLQAIIASTQLRGVVDDTPALGELRSASASGAVQERAAEGHEAAVPAAVLPQQLDASSAAAAAAIAVRKGGTFRRSASARVTGERSMLDDWALHPLRGAFTAVGCAAWTACKSQSGSNDLSWTGKHLSTARMRLAALQKLSGHLTFTPHTHKVRLASAQPHAQNSFVSLRFWHSRDAGVQEQPRGH